MLSFEVRKSGGESEVRKVQRDVIHIGASTGNDLVVRARGVLGRHARISVAGEELRLEVLGSAPGSDVTLNGSIVQTAALAAGDRINIGEATITLLNGPGPQPEPDLGPPPRGRDALSVATAALSRGGLRAPSAVPTAAPAAPRARPRPAPASRPAAPPEAVRPDERGPSSDLWAGFYAVLRRPVPFEELLQDVVTYVASATPLHSLAFVSLLPANEGEAIAAVWKGTLPKLTPAVLADARAMTGPTDVVEGGTRLKVVPVPRRFRGSRRPARPPGRQRWPTRPFSTSPRTRRPPSASCTPSAARPPSARTTPPDSPRRRRPPASTTRWGSSWARRSRCRTSRRRSRASPRPGRPILLVGDVGSGKTLVAETLHALSPRRGRPIVRVAATRGEPAGARGGPPRHGGAGGDRRRRTGRLFEADGGTLLVEEVGDLPPATQAFLFRLLEAREVVAPGGRTVPIDVRVIGTSSRPLTRAVEDGHFRDDLYFRLSALTLRLPPLKDRKEDIPALLDALAARHGGPTAARFDVEAMNALLNYQYPGNVRELENEVRRLAAQVGSGAIALADLDQKFSGEHVELALKESDDLKEIVEKVERQVIERVMRKVRGNQSLGARLLNISRGSLIAKMKQYDIKDFRYLKRQD